MRTLRTSEERKSYETVGGGPVSSGTAFRMGKSTGGGRSKLTFKGGVEPAKVRAEVAGDLNRGKHRLALDKAKCYDKTVGTADRDGREHGGRGERKRPEKGVNGYQRDEKHAKSSRISSDDEGLACQ